MHIIYYFYMWCNSRVISMGNFKCENLPFGLKITSENIQNENQETLCYYYEKFWIEFAVFLV